MDIEAIFVIEMNTLSKLTEMCRRVADNVLHLTEVAA
jgi:hypothetical protein